MRSGCGEPVRAWCVLTCTAVDARHGCRRVLQDGRAAAHGCAACSPESAAWARSGARGKGRYPELSSSRRVSFFRPSAIAASMGISLEQRLLTCSTECPPPALSTPRSGHARPGSGCHGSRGSRGMPFATATATQSARTPRARHTRRTPGLAALSAPLSLTTHSTLAERTAGFAATATSSCRRASAALREKRERRSLAPLSLVLEGRASPQPARGAGCRARSLTCWALDQGRTKEEDRSTGPYLGTEVLLWTYAVPKCQPRTQPTRVVGVETGLAVVDGRREYPAGGVVRLAA